jgi:uncharacterized protein YndB with AHSA1/START domain
MKYVKYALLTMLALLLAAISTLWIMSRRDGANTMRASVEINRPVETVWPYLEEPDKLKEWVGWVVKIEVVSGDKQGNPHGGGAKSRWTMEDKNNGGALMVLEDEVTGYERFRLIEVRQKSGGEFSGVSTFRVAAGNGKTRIDTEATFEFEQAFARLLTPLILPSAEAKFQEDLERLKRIVEAR